ncbi:hypothetical protein AO242_21035 [Pseudomonas sp. ICMP 561]|nr:hypothetical protein AO242_21035 [Pseudomonas sp. ICMP 561]
MEITQDPSAHSITLILLHRTELITDNHQVYCRLTEILERVKSYIVAVLKWRVTDAAGTSSAGILAAATSIKALMTGIIFEWMLNQSEVKLDDIQQNFEVLIPSIIHSRLA